MTDLNFFFNASFEAIILTENGICIDQNQRAEEMFGLPMKKSLVNMPSNVLSPNNGN